MRNKTSAFFDLVGVMRRLRAPDGCPWDQEQNAQSLKPFLLEEVHEVLEALDSKDSDAVCEELGDLLLQIVFLAQIFSEQGLFDIEDVARGITDKLIRRHPHVFSDEKCTDLEELNRQWERIKKDEKRNRGESPRRSPLPLTLPALARAQKLLEPPEPSDPAALHARIGECLQALANPCPETRERNLGEALAHLVTLGRQAEVNSEQALRSYLRHLENHPGARRQKINDQQTS
ncbi:nucleoside triphosphate pyrophosphohydrolase [Geoalkalibacter halelectricus]|uniref:MazG family protein n=1 Tax=Geoalkalibacter halelectricus TaxID=2847045 RepID=A0ABY5ZNY9_9BACT|nr:MazG family protein [Geoalkalibacter halelectricus]MDO3380035.1 MazG family protein [Geoalkalibacter halelectricus]UWZ80441.1 MazG family protein [Geoalkalibacter halelectricus]